MRGIAVISFLWLFSSGVTVCDAGKIDLDFSLPVPADLSHITYLGLEAKDNFFLEEIKSKILIIEIFSMYCPICQREAANVNKMFELIQKNPTYRDQVKLIGIGAGNSAFEVAFFKENYEIKFPLFSDTKFVIHKKIGEKGTPFFIGLKPTKDKGVEIFFTFSGAIKDPDQFLKTLLKSSGLIL